MTDIEIPFEKDRKGHYRFFEVLPGLLSWTLLLTPFILGHFNVMFNGISINLAVIFILFYLLIFFTRGLAYSRRAITGYRAMREQLKLDWNGLSADIDEGVVTKSKITRPKWHLKNLRLLDKRQYDFRPSELTHAVIVATVNESREVLEPTIQAILANDFNPKRLILVIAYEERAGRPAQERVQALIKQYGGEFKHAMAVKHPPDLPEEVIGKGGNITYAARKLQKYLERQKLDPRKVIVTTLDADNRPDKRYFAALSYLYCVVPNPLRASYQPLPMFTNNIWDAPTLMRVIATGNNLFYIVGTQRLHMIRNFSAHAQPMSALIDMDFWSRRTIVEDGHQFWRSYFRYDGDYRVYPISVPIYQDAVLADGYLRTIRAQFIQLRRWTYGASDVAYIADKGFWHKNKAPKADVLAKLLRCLEGHVGWATNTILVLGSGFVPIFIQPQNIGTNELPLIVKNVQNISLAALIVLVYICLVTLPPRPARYRRHRSVFMLLQWVLVPFTSIGFGSLAALNSQTRLMFKWYLSKFDTTEKATVDATGHRTSTEADPGKQAETGWYERLALRRKPKKP
jgi:cellulose synthase/poly-beta-1,6-N-acetylglucosamine synthase-like glycosyltransferase